MKNSNDIQNESNDTSSSAPASSLEMQREGLVRQQISRRGLLGIVGQGALGLAALALFQGSGSPAFAGDGRTKLERMMPGARELKGGKAGQPMPGIKSFLAASPLTFTPSLPMWGDGQNFNQPEYYETLCVGDVDGDGQDELIVRGPAGILVERFDPKTGQWVTLTSAGPAFSDAKGWNGPQAYQTIRCVDVDGDGKDEILGRDGTGMLVFQYNATTQKFDALPTLTDLAGGFANGPVPESPWVMPEHYNTIKCGHIGPIPTAQVKYGQVIARGPDGVSAWHLFDGNTWTLSIFPKIPWLDTDPNDGTNWLLPQYYETIQIADIDGDGQEEIIGRAASGLQVWKQDNGFWRKLYGGTTSSPSILADYEEWSYSPSYYSTIQCADIDGDGKKEIVARNGLNLIAYHYGTDANGNVIFTRMPDGPAFSDAGGWNQPQYYSTLRFGDINCDTREELIIRDGSGIQTWMFTNDAGWINLSGNHAANIGLPAWGDQGGGPDANGTPWNEVQYYSTLRLARTKPDTTDRWFYNPNTKPISDSMDNPRWAGPYATLVARDKYGIQTWRYHGNDEYDEDGGYWARTTAPMPDFTSDNANANQKAAYIKLDTLIRGLNATGNIRDTYNNQSADFSTWAAAMYTMPLGTTYYGPYIAPRADTCPIPAGIDPAAWNQVTWQIYWEMAYVIKVNDWYATKMAGLINSMAFGKSLTVQTVGDYMNIPPTDNSTVGCAIASLVFNGAWAVLGFPGLADAEGELAALPGQLSAISGILATAYSAATLGSTNDNGSWQGAYADLEGKMEDAFAAAITSNSNLNLFVTGGSDGLTSYHPGDFGMLAAIGQQILGGGNNNPWTWPTSTDDIVANSQHGFVYQVWQSILPASSWFLASDTNNGLPGGPSNDHETPPPYHYDPTNGGYPDRDEWLCTSTSSETSYPATDSQDQLFQTPAKSTDIFPLGVPITDVFLGNNGWPELGKHNFAKPYDAVPRPRPVALGADLRPEIELSRNATTGAIEVSLTLRNKGLGAAANVEIVSAQLGSRPAIEPLPHDRTRLAGGKEWKTTVKFPANTAQSGQMVVLRLQGRYKTGTFGGSYRVKMP